MRIPIAKHFIPLFLLAFSLISHSFALAEEQAAVSKIKPQTLSQEIPIEIFADEISHFKEKDRIVARGRVQIKYKNRFLFADKIVLNSKTGFGEARGNVFYKDDKEEIKCERAQFNVEKKEGILFEVKAFIGKQYRIEGKEFERYDDKRYRAAEATITTCDGPLPFWSLCSKEVDGEQEGFMTMEHSTFNIRGVPILYLPYWYASIASKRKSGFLMPEFQYSSNDGSTIKVPYYWAINQSQDVTFLVSYLSKKGFKPEAEYRYVLDEKSSGKFSGLYLKENDTKRTFWEARYTHTQEFDNNLRIFGTGFLQDRSNSYTKEFSTLLEEQAVTTSYANANLSKEWDDFSFLAQVSYEQSLQFNSDQSLANLPNLRLFGYQQRIGESPFYVALNSNLNYIEERKGSDKNLSKRADVRPSLIFQRSLHPWVNVTASATGLFTLYQQSEQQNGSTIDQITFMRKLYHLNGTLKGPSLSKTYGKAFKHIVQPFLEYNYIPNNDKSDRRRIALYDEMDALSNMNKFTYGFNNTVIGYFKKGDTYVPRKVMSLLLQQSYRVDNLPTMKVSPFDNLNSDIEQNGIANYTVPTETRHRFSNLYGKLDLYLADGYTLIADAEITPRGNRTDKFNVSLQRSVDDNELTLSRRYNRLYNNYWSVEASQSIYDDWRIRYQNGYSEANKKILYHLGGIDYTAQCWGFSLEYLKKSTVINNVFKDNNRITLLINFSGLGSVGKKN